MLHTKNPTHSSDVDSNEMHSTPETVSDLILQISSSQV